MAYTKRTTHTTRSLSRRAALVQTTIIAVVILVFSLAIVSFNTYRLYSQLESRVDNIARLAETSLTSAVWQVDHASARDFIEAVLQDDSVVFAQLVTGREVLASRNRMEYASKPFSYFKQNKRFIARTVEIRKFGDWIGTFNFAVSTSPIREEVLINAGVTLLLAIVLILTISQTTLYFSRKRIFAPLKQLEESATAVADGDLDAFVNTSLPGELGNLARAFDDMRESVRHLIGDLQTANTKLKNHRNDLEETVRQRTDELRHKNDTLNQALEDVRAAQKSAEVANLAKSRFLASMSHEIRTPMNAILGMADILWETDLSDAQSRYVQVFKSAGESLLEILNDILDLSKIEAGHLELEQTGFSLAETVDKACSVIEPRTQDKSLEFSCNIAADVPDWLEGDPNRLRQILLNLLGNAVKFTKTGAIRLFVERAPSRTGGIAVQFSVSDTGPGIPTNKLGSIFDSFTQADSSTTREYGGTGLGLAISKQLVQMMDGKIWAESSPGTGSTFHFTATFSPPDTLQPSEPETQAETEQVELPPANILLMEDSKYNAFVIQTYLKDTPCRLTVAKNGTEGFELFKKGQYDLVFTDIQMPGMDGHETTRAIREWEAACALPRTPIVAMTAYALTGDAEKCLQAGADSHLPKPVKKSSLFTLISTILSEKKLAAETSSPASDADTEETTVLRQNIDAAAAALEREDFPSIKALGTAISQNGLELSIPSLIGYGDALREAADNEPDTAQINQILSILTEYVERLNSM
ncbi:ATP-binding protein [uncultured Pseudodesulfovibrio sp.]|uniref:ATP-binding protein n=1 Tax=uncultured Pseudodesulfovibrio sp. TaxID=2035858 RepID=UPI0029C94113|nr:ATP-binding protein [uncultured Pseudodesulfovibrio sp.]